jgi:hypothetical protein
LKNFGIKLEPILRKDGLFCFSPLTTHALRLTIEDSRYALCAMRDVEVAMPAIASLEDLKAAQKDLLETKENDDL